MSTQADGPDGPPGDDEFAERRAGRDRRKGLERRTGGRRHQQMDASAERRSGTDRRSASRRKVKDRRKANDPRYKKRPRKTGSVYTAAEITKVQHMLSRAGPRSRCPSCDGPFTLGPIDRRKKESVRQVWCVDCGRGCVVTNCVLARVMVLANMDQLRQLLRSMLTVAGHELIEPPSPTAALEAYRDNPADVVIIGPVMLKESQGQDFMRQLRMEFHDARTIVIAQRPSYRAADPSATAVQLGATRVLRMPFTREDLLLALKEARQ